MDGEVLPGGVANAGAVVREGPDVLRPAGAHTATVHRFLAALHATGFAGVPVPVGLEDDRRERLRFIKGQVAVPPYPAWVQSDEALASLSTLTQRFHEASERVGLTQLSWSREMSEPGGGALVCHNDICLENVVFHGTQAVALLDFDFASPGDPLRDLASMARMCVPVDDPHSAAALGWSAADRVARTRLVTDTYGLDADERHRFLEFLGASIARGGEWVQRKVEAGDPNFTTMWNEIGGMARFDRRRAWWSEHLDRFTDALR